MSSPVCKFYSLNQTCRFGKNCRFVHRSSSQRPPPSNTDQLEEDESVSNQGPPSETRHFISPNTTSHNEATVRQESQRGRYKFYQSFQPTSGHRANQNAVVNRSRTDWIEQGNSQNQVCRYFAQGRRCYYGKNCRFLHTRLSGDESPSNNLLPPQVGEEADQPQPLAGRDNNSLSTGAEKPENVRAKPSTPSRGGRGRKPQNRDGERRVCSFYRAGHCRRGRSCKFLHFGPSTSDENINYTVESRKENESGPGAKKENQSAKAKERSYPMPGVLKQVLTLAELEEIGVTTVRNGEINTIKKRVPSDKTTIVKDTEEIFIMRVIFTPSDPDWPFDVKTFELLMTVPKMYPEECLSVKLPSDQNMPETIRRYVEITVGEWLMERHTLMKNKGKVELVFRPFLRWLDRNLEEITTEALKQLKRELVAKAIGMEFLSPSQLRDKLKVEALDNGKEPEGSDSDGEESDDLSSTSGSSSEGEDDEEDGQQMGLTLDPEKKGTQMELRHLQLKENASALLFDKLKLVLQCGRCKNHCDVLVPQANVMSVTCRKCNTSQYVHYRAALAHQFSSIVGYLDLDGCTAFDLILQDCRAVVTCMGCSKLSRIEGLVSGQMIDGWCQACNAKFKIATEAVKFSQLAPSGVDKGNSKTVEVTKNRRPPKDPAIREGYPLPEFGTCKHYKHSYRWLRFPCCGKAYPCDVCHDKKEDHEFVFATRMICGHCCKEQNFAASRPCNGCSQHLTKIRSAHWEGGKGCRDKISMSKNDQQKYRNLSKTQSNHKKLLQNGGKKNTKLRHS